MLAGLISLVQHAVLVADPQGVADIQRDLLGQGGGLLGGVVQVSGAQLVQRGQASPCGSKCTAPSDRVPR